MNTWLWPDREISKSESRRLREEHNALVNLNADLLRALQRIESNAYVYTREHVAIIARDAIAKAAK